MSSTKIGNRLEKSVCDYFRLEMNSNRLPLKKSLCKIFEKKSYYSKDRNSNIEFDISIEIFLPGMSEYWMLLLIECKNYTHPVPVDDAEEFFAKVQQVASANVKAVIASTASFARGTREYSKSKGIGLLRYFDASGFKWELARSSSAYVSATNENSAARLDAGLSQENFVSTVFNLYMQSPLRDTNSLWDFVEDFLLQTSLTTAQRSELKNSKNFVPQVPFRKKEYLEKLTNQIRNKVGYIAGKVCLADICEYEKKRCNLKIELDVELPKNSNTINSILGRISFAPLQIEVFAQPQPNAERERFTLAHELAHHLLGHSKFMSAEICEETDFLLNRNAFSDIKDIVRMEYQANYFAASLLMPKEPFIRDFQTAVRSLDVVDRGYGALFVDDQPCNRQNYEMVTNHLMQRYGVSRSAATIRLEGLELVHDARGTGAQKIGALVQNSLEEKYPLPAYDEARWASGRDDC